MARDHWYLQIQIFKYNVFVFDIDGLVHERHNSSTLAMELRLSYTKPLIFSVNDPIIVHHVMLNC